MAASPPGLGGRVRGISFYHVRPPSYLNKSPVITDLRSSQRHVLVRMRTVVPGLRLAQERGPKDERYLGLGLAQFFGKTQPQRYVVERLAGPGINHQRGEHHAPTRFRTISNFVGS